MTSILLNFYVEINPSMLSVEYRVISLIAASNSIITFVCVSVCLSFCVRPFVRFCPSVKVFHYHIHILIIRFSWVTVHDDVIKWKHFPRYWPFVRGIHRSPVKSPHKGQWRGALMFSLICVWINGWVNNGEAGDLRRYRTHYDVTVMKPEQMMFIKQEPIISDTTWLMSSHCSVNI